MFYQQFLDASEAEVRAEIQRWERSWVTMQDKPQTVLDTLLHCDKQFFPVIYELLRIFLTLPVTTASGERCFSTMRRLKTYLRSSMTQERFTGLALINLHRNIDIPIDHIINKFKLCNPNSRLHL